MEFLGTRNLAYSSHSLYLSPEEPLISKISNAICMRWLPYLRLQPQVCLLSSRLHIWVPSCHLHLHVIYHLKWKMPKKGFSIYPPATPPPKTLFSLLPISKRDVKRCRHLCLWYTPRKSSVPSLTLSPAPSVQSPGPVDSTS